MPESVAGIIKKNNLYLLGKRKPGGSIGGKWEFPGGKVKKGESFEESLKREFKEELNVHIHVNNFIGKINFKSIDHSFILYAYYIEILDEDITTNEHDEFKWFTLDEIRNLKNDLAESDQLLLDII
ncbi:MAG: (deoxy)nucleoside triphosphate pyrophosphohydrolase [Spirochaetales bacterium]|nr:(deoxy)nucleoside triphosphate pyrophosphohydrolase [Spirochaetales bacterium]